MLMAMSSRFLVVSTGTPPMVRMRSPTRKPLAYATPSSSTPITVTTFGMSLSFTRLNPTSPPASSAPPLLSRVTPDTDWRSRALRSSVYGSRRLRSAAEIPASSAASSSDGVTGRMNDDSTSRRVAWGRWWAVWWWCGVAVWCGVVWCGVVWRGVVWCGVVWCGAVRCGVVVVL